MLKLLRYTFLGILAIALIGVASANRGLVTLRLLPDEMDAFLGIGWAAELPLFVVIFAGILTGLAIGFTWEWLREAKLRAEAGQHKRQVGDLEREVSRLRAVKAEPGDDVVALLEAKSLTR